jgi:hypothetical protein
MSFFGISFRALDGKAARHSVATTSFDLRAEQGSKGSDDDERLAIDGATRNVIPAAEAAESAECPL